MNRKGCIPEAHFRYGKAAIPEAHFHTPGSPLPPIQSTLQRAAPVACSRSSHAPNGKRGQAPSPPNANGNRARAGLVFPPVLPILPAGWWLASNAVRYSPGWAVAVMLAAVGCGLACGWWLVFRGRISTRTNEDRIE
jgi:hypothetical protein